MGLRYFRGHVAILVLLFRLLAVFLGCPGRQGGFVFVDSAVTDGRHSYSLTTFDPDGKLGQVERALVAASLGTPIVGVVKGENIILASPQILPSPLMNDDGTTRFAAISPQIVLGHSGIASDGRVVLESAQRLAIEHSYTYDEPIPINLFLEEISLLFQSYTMKPGARPFGCTLLVGYLPPHSNSEACGKETFTANDGPRLFKIDCSGSVVELETVAVINGKQQQGAALRTKLEDFAKQEEEVEVSGRCKRSAKKDRESIYHIVEDVFKNLSSGSKMTRKTKALSKEDKGNINDDEFAIKLPSRIITASFGLEGGFKVDRFVATDGSESSIP
uniref:Proteasome alpha-type subunits domain-containing protein n=1 Tax=Pseudo-nitzschia arenysensis TaxID=697910 RepID=A0A6T9YIM9_9STRA|mmetsp:Transcript_665/g.1592  ORF Transcript_665/g.1592 Transcript_665/m.1592 type:complete len:332 (+) Transcript_665:104-1099(+)